MKKIILSLIAVISFSLSGMAQEEGKFVFGAGVQLWDFDEFGVQGKAVYGLNETLDIGGAFTYYFSDFIDFSIDANVQYKGLDLSDDFKVQPLAGVTYTKWSIDTPFGNFGGGSGTDIHIGASFRFVLQSGTTIYAEPILILGSGSPLNIAAGILF